MISFHRGSHYDASLYKTGWTAVDTTDPRRIARCMATQTYSACIWKKNIRMQRNFLAADLCIMDFDDGELTLSQAVKNFCDMKHVIGTTKSHGIKGDRFRVVLFFEEKITDLRLFRWNMKRLVKTYPIDSACVDGARFYYRCKEIVSVCEEGYLQAVNKEIPEKFGKPRPINPSLLNSKTIPNHIYERLRRDFRKFHRNSAVYIFAISVAPMGFTDLEILNKLKESNVLNLLPHDLDDDAELLRTINNALKAHNKESCDG